MREPNEQEVRELADVVRDRSRAWLNRELGDPDFGEKDGNGWHFIAREIMRAGWRIRSELARHCDYCICGDCGAEILCHCGSDHAAHDGIAEDDASPPLGHTFAPNLPCECLFGRRA